MSHSKKRLILNVDERELATILAALRFHQDENLQRSADIPDQTIKEIAANSGLLKPLNSDETVRYVRHRLRVAGGSSCVFDIFAILAIFYFSGGVPRLINTLCDYALVHAYAQDKPVVDVDTALETVAGKRIGGVHRFVKASQDREEARMAVQKLTGVDLAEVIEGLAIS